MIHRVQICCKFSANLLVYQHHKRFNYLRASCNSSWSNSSWTWFIFFSTQLGWNFINSSFLDLFFMFFTRKNYGPTKALIKMQLIRVMSAHVFPLNSLFFKVDAEYISFCFYRCDMFFMLLSGGCGTRSKMTLVYSVENELFPIVKKMYICDQIDI